LRPTTDTPAAGSAIGAAGRTRDILNRYGIAAKKSLGQNFLVDRNILRRIVQAAELAPDHGVLEIGPGIGALTEELAQSAGKVVAVEIDRRLIPVLNEVLQPYPNAVVVQGDILKLDLTQLWSTWFADCAQVNIAANLPYYITTPIIMRLLENGVRFRHMVVMIQKEVAERIAAPPGGKAYGSLSVAVRYYCEFRTIAAVPPTVFIPPPKVESAVIRLTRREQPAVRVNDERLFFAVVQAAFAQRRKTLANNLMHRYGKERKAAILDALERAGIDPARRGETLAIEEFARLADEIGAALARDAQPGR
jgi:16S rRNA (adenine1518-N6/adenine1519-N6)-dimethyltransferase